MKFLESVSFGQYVPSNSWMHRLDPRTKVCGLILLLAGVFMASKPYDWPIWVVMLLLGVLKLIALKHYLVAM